MSFLKTLDDKIEWYFRPKERGSSYLGELRAGIVLFMTSSYILFLNPLILSGGSGATNTGMPSNDVALATAISTGIATTTLGIVGNYPWVVSVQLGTNTYFVYTIIQPNQPCNHTLVNFMPSHTFFTAAGTSTCAGAPCTCEVAADGSYFVPEVGTAAAPGPCFGLKEFNDCQGSKIPYEKVLAATFLEGLVFMLICLTGLRGIILRYLPNTVLMSGATGIGVFIAFVGIKDCEFIVQSDYPTLTKFIGANWPYAPDGYGTADSGLSFNDCVMYFDGPPYSVMCPWLAMSGLILTGILTVWNINGAFIVGIAWTTFVSWIVFPDTIANGGLVPSKAVQTPRFEQTAGALDFHWSPNTGTLIGALITFLYLDFLGSAITFMSMGVMQGIVDEYGNIPRANMAFMADAIGTTFGGLLGSSALTTYVESASAVREGGRTGLTALICALLFFLMVFFSPIFSTINNIATGPILTIIGVLIFMSSVIEIPWADLSEAIPAFITIITMPTTNNIAYGVIAGIVAWLICQFVAFKFPFQKNWPLAATIHAWTDPDSRTLLMRIPGWNCNFDEYYKKERPIKNPYLNLLMGISRKYGEAEIESYLSYRRELDAATAKAREIQSLKNVSSPPPVGAVLETKEPEVAKEV